VRAVGAGAQGLRASVSAFIGNMAVSGMARSLQGEVEPIKWQRACAVGKTKKQPQEIL
jgi:hypothetical protein